MNIERLKKQIIEHEGFRNKAYPDTLGNWTTGIGHLIKLPDEEYLINTRLKDYEVEHIFNTDLNQAIDDARKFIDEHSIKEEAFEIIVDMSFNLGLPKLSQFKNLKQALENGDYVRASQEMLSSRWAKQLPNRAGNLAKKMEQL